MKRQFWGVMIALLALVWTAQRGLLAQVGAGDPLVGTFSGEGLKIEIAAGDTGYTGTVQREQSSYPLTATRQGAGWAGQFKVGANSFDCSATLGADGALIFSTGGAKYTLQPLRPAAPAAANPLGSPTARNDNPVAPTGNVGGILGGGAPKPATPAPGKKVEHPGGFACLVPAGWNGQPNGQFIEMFGPTSPTTGQPTAYMRAAAVTDPTFTQLNDPNYLRGAAASLQRSEPGMTPAGEPTMVTRGSTTLAVLPFTLQTAARPEPLASRTVLGVISGNKIAIVCMICEPQKLAECEALAITAANSMINGCDNVAEPAGKVFPKAPADNGKVDASPLEGNWSNPEKVWSFKGAMLKVSPNIPRSDDPNVIIVTDDEEFFYDVANGKVYTSKDPRPAWEHIEKDCKIYTYKLVGDQLTLTDPAGAAIALRRDRSAR